MSEPVVYDFGDAPEHVCPVSLGGQRVDLIIRSPGRTLRLVRKLGAEDPVEAQEVVAALLRESWPESRQKLPENDEAAFQHLYDSYGMQALIVAANRLAVRVSSMYPDPKEVAERAKFFPDKTGLDGPGRG